MPTLGSAIAEPNITRTLCRSRGPRVRSQNANNRGFFFLPTVYCHLQTVLIRLHLRHAEPIARVIDHDDLNSVELIFRLTFKFDTLGL